MTRSTDIPAIGDFVAGNSLRIRGLIAEAREVARTRESILVLGETGTGKERLAREIHAMSSRKDGPWVPINCASLTPDLADSELFGHVRGAFTGAVSARSGLLKTANSGTIFLDEIGDLPLSTQVKLLRVFEDHRIRAQGADGHERIDVRIIAATSADVQRVIRDGRFRRDFHERFQATLHIPPLRDRSEDIEPLARHFVALHAGGEGLNPAAKDISTAAVARLRAGAWSGNARELERAVKSALAKTFISRSEVLQLSDFAFADRQPDLAPVETATKGIQALAAFLLGELENGRVAVATVEELSRRYWSVSLKNQLAKAFLSRYRGAEAHEKAKLLFGYSSGESVRRLLRSGPPREEPSPPVVELSGGAYSTHPESSPEVVVPGPQTIPTGTGEQ
jgi:transcriptional regulator with PAS, ATPase and Fis domain